MALTVALTVQPHLLKPATQADRGQRVLQDAALGQVHVNPAGGATGNIILAPQRLQTMQALPVITAQQQRDAQPESVGEQPSQPYRLTGQQLRRLLQVWQPEHLAVTGSLLLQQFTIEHIAALHRLPPSAGDEVTEQTIATAITRQHDQVTAFLQMEFAADQ